MQAIGVHTKLLAEFGLELSEETFDTIDLDDDGYITWEELLVFVHAQSNQEKGLHKSNLDLQRELVTKEVELSQTLRDALQWKKQVERLHQQALELKEALLRPRHASPPSPPLSTTNSAVIIRLFRRVAALLSLSASAHGGWLWLCTGRY
jgi:hypothetical protein